MRAQDLRSEAAALRALAAAQRRHANEVADRLAESLLQFDGRPLGERGGRFTLRLARLRPLVRLARRDLRRWLEQEGLSQEVVNEITLACAEACANAVEHPTRVSRQAFEVAARQDDAGELVLRVRDFGRWREAPRSPLRGRGLRMIREVMDSVDVVRRPDGTRIVMRRSIVADRST